MENNSEIPKHYRSIEPLWRVAKLFKPSREVFPVGIREFDFAMAGGLRDGELITISGRTGEGKTTFAQDITINLSKSGIPSVWFTYEMSPYYLNQKFIQMGHSPTDPLIYSPLKLMEEDLVFIDQEVVKASEERAVKVVFIDHLHYLIPLSQEFNSSLLVGKVVRSLKTMAVKRNVIVFLIAHTKKIYQDESLDLSSIRDSSLIAQESDYVFLVERIKEKHRRAEEEHGSIYTNQTRVSLAKNRRTGKVVYITCNFVKGRFVPITHVYEE